MIINYLGTPVYIKNMCRQAPFTLKVCAPRVEGGGGTLYHTVRVVLGKRKVLEVVDGVISP